MTNVLDPEETPMNELDAETLLEWEVLENLPDGRSEVAIREFRVHELRGSFPKVDTYASVNVDLLTQGDTKPFYLVLPIARTGEISQNRLSYDKELVEAIAEQLQGLGGIRGHIPTDQAATAFPVEDVDWVGHKMVGDTLFAKGYIPPGETREYVRRLMARNGKLSTSIFGKGIVGESSNGGTRLLNFSLEQVDLAPAKKASLQLGGEFAIVTEMKVEHQERTETMTVTKDMLAGLSAAELHALLDDSQSEQIAQMVASKQNKRIVAAELVSGAGVVPIAEFEAVKANETKLLREKDALTEEVGRYRVAEFKAGLEGVVDAQFAHWQNLDQLSDAQKLQFNAVKAQLRGRVVSELGSSQDLALAAVKADAVMKSDEFRPVVEMMMTAFAGGSALGGNNRDAAKEAEIARDIERGKGWTK